MHAGACVDCARLPTVAVPSLTPWRSFLISLSLVVFLAVAAAFTGVAVSSQQAVEMELLTRGRALFSSIVLTRSWSSAHGGVFVVKRPGDVANPYLERPDRLGADGTIYTLKNPALMTREISELAERQGSFRFHITSLKPLNPANGPDAFEREMLSRFEEGLSEATLRQVRDGTPWFRYMAPLLVQESCLECHAKQGYKVGDVRGGISVDFNMAAAQGSISRTRWIVGTTFLATAALLVLIIARLVSGLRRRLQAAEARIREMALTDELTGLANRRQISDRFRMEWVRAARYQRPISVVLIDVDHFKAVNDSYGHDAGDAVLRGVSRKAASALRASDLLGRWGGEEFLALLPETEAAGARGVAERVLAEVAALREHHSNRVLSVTVSAGVATWTPPGDGSDAEALLKRADEALYRAKAAGRNRVEGWDVWPTMSAPPDEETLTR